MSFAQEATNYIDMAVNLYSIIVTTVCKSGLLVVWGVIHDRMCALVHIRVALDSSCTTVY